MTKNFTPRDYRNPFLPTRGSKASRSNCEAIRGCRCCSRNVERCGISKNTFIGLVESIICPHCIFRSNPRLISDRILSCDGVAFEYDSNSCTNFLNTQVIHDARKNTNFVHLVSYRLLGTVLVTVPEYLQEETTVLQSM